MLSVLIPTYNYNIVPLVTAVQQQCSDAGIPFEIIACDDASDGQTLLSDDLVSRFPKLKYIKNPVNLGRTLTRRKLAETAIFNNLLFLDADVLPVSNNFIKIYLPYLNKNMAVFGGYAYEDTSIKPDNLLRYSFGKQREEAPASKRNEQPYCMVFSGNFLTNKAIFFENNYPKNDNFYGLDLYFGYSLYKNSVNVCHIDNPIYHLGLESDVVFFRKSLEAVKNRKVLLEDYSEIAMTNGLAKHYLKLKEIGIDKIVGLGFKLTEPLLRKMILRKKPNLFAFDVYRLGYICSLK